MSLPAQSSRAIDALTKAIRQVMEVNPDRKFEGIGNCSPGRTDVGARSLIFGAKPALASASCASPKYYRRKKARSH
jgi:hypothetical protein